MSNDRKIPPTIFFPHINCRCVVVKLTLNPVTMFKNKRRIISVSDNGEMKVTYKD